MPTDNECSECGAPISARAITCSTNCRQRRSYRRREIVAVQNVLTADNEVSEVAGAVEALSGNELQVMLAAFHGLSNSTENYTPGERELFASVVRLLARCRDMTAKRERSLKRADRQARLLQDSTANSALKDEFDSLVKNN